MGNRIIFTKGKLSNLLLVILLPTHLMCSSSDPNNPRPGPAVSDTGLVVKKFTEATDIVENPGQGWMSSSRFTGALTYVRFEWDDLNPAPDVYDWSAIDNRLDRVDLSKGQMFAFRIMASNAHSTDKYTSPPWLFEEKGCKGYDYRIGGNNDPTGGILIDRVSPDYDDPVFTEWHGKFLKALGERYNNHPKISYIDIGSYGNWGEWHPDYSPDAKQETLNRFVDMYVDAFPDTRMVFMTDHAVTLAYALGKSQHIGLRRDGVGSPQKAREWAGSDVYALATEKGMGERWKTAPVVFEWWGNYDFLMSQNWSFDEAIQWMLDNHVSLLLDNIGEIPESKMALIEKLSKYAGARIVPQEIKYPRKAARGTDISFEITLSNKGVAPMYDDYVQRLFLYNSVGDIIAAQDGTNDPNSWIPGNYQISEKLNIPSTLTPGTYQVAYALAPVDGTKIPFRLAVTDPDNNGIYLLGNITIE